MPVFSKPRRASQASDVVNVKNYFDVLKQCIAYPSHLLSVAEKTALIRETAAFSSGGYRKFGNQYLESDIAKTLTFSKDSNSAYFRAAVACGNVCFGIGILVLI